MRRVGITGFGVVSPIGIGKEAFWESLSRGTEGIAPITHFDASTFDVQLAGEVKQALELPQAAEDVVREDPKVGFAVMACQEALTQAGIAGFDAQTVLHLGTSLEIFDLEKIVHAGKADFPAVANRSLQPGARPLQVPLDAANRILQKIWGLPMASNTNCSACAAGAQAIGLAARAIRFGRAEVAICGAFDSMLNPLGVGGFQLLGALTTDTVRGGKACRPFDADRSGTVLGEGAAVFVLEPLEKAHAEGKTILAEICGYGSSLDSHSLSAPDPEGNGAIRAMQSALRDAGLAPAAIHHINAHGTGTHLNDEIEARAIRQVFPDWERIPVSATKSMTGHLIAAAGAIEVGACLLPFMKNVLPPNISLERIAPECELHHVQHVATLFDGEYILSNSFGFGGQNAALILRRMNHA